VKDQFDPTIGIPLKRRLAIELTRRNIMPRGLVLARRLQHALEIMKNFWYEIHARTKNTVDTYRA
jgi:hypothetical protein